MKPRKALTVDLINLAVGYYKFKLTEDEVSRLENHGCFSQPSLELHECNARVKLPGHQECTFCHHNIYRPCDISCDFQTFCLAVYAWRLGIGGEDLYKAIQRNLYKITPDQLYDEVISCLVGGGSSVEKEVEGGAEEFDESEELKVDNNSVIVPEISEADEKCYSVSDTANLLKRTAPYVYLLLKKGVLKKVKSDSAIKVSQSSIDAYKDNCKNRKKVKNGAK